MKLNTLLYVSVACLLFLQIGVDAQDDDTRLDRAMEAYFNNRLSTARKLARDFEDRPRGMMVLAFCDLFDTASRNWKRGIERLQAAIGLAADEPELQRALTMSLVDTLWGLELMDEMPSGVDMDIEPMCRKMMAVDPPVVESWEAFMILYQRAVLMDAGPERDARMAELEAYAEAHPQKPYFSHACKAFGSYYIWHGESEKGVAWMDRADIDDFQVPMIQLFMLMTPARIKHRELNDKEGALDAYRRVIEHFPYQGAAAKARQFIRELEGGE